jgi:hypothetical protein
MASIQPEKEDEKTMLTNGQEHENTSILSRKCFLTIFTIAIVVRIGCMVVRQSWELPDNWQFGYEIGQIGQSLADGHGFTMRSWVARYSPTAKFPPVYVYLVGGVFKIFGVYSKTSAVVLFSFQSICAAFTAVFLTALGNRLLGWKSGVIAGLLWAFYPSSLFYSVVRVWYCELAVMLLLLLIIIGYKLKPYPDFFRVICLGGLSGLIILTDSTMAAYLGLFFFLMLGIWKVRLQRWIVLSGLWIITAGVVVTPWGIRNYMVLGTSGILKSNPGMELFFGNNPYSTGGGINKEREQALDALDQEELIYHRRQAEHVYFSYLQKHALEWIRQNPFRFFQLSAKRIWYFWGKFPSSGPGPWRTYTWIQFVWYAPLVLLALYGCWYSIRRRLNLTPIWLFLLVYPLPFYITHVQLYRYRYPVEPFLLLLAAIPLTIWFERCWGFMKGRLNNLN